MEIDWQLLIFEFVGGIGIFLLGIKFMGDGLQRSAGDKLRYILDKFTSNPFLGVLAGMIVAILIQSSSATTVITIGLVNAGFLTLRQAIGVVMGANIGTTAIAFIIGLDITEYALPIIALGAFLIYFFKNQKVVATGQAIFGVGALFLGLDLMNSGMAPLGSLEFFQDFTVSMSDVPILGVVVGTVFTMIVQSSTATIAILQGLFAEGVITLKAALPVLFGDNIGTTITAVLASLGASIAARRTALSHVIFNLFGATLFLIFLGPFTTYIEFLQSQFNLNAQMTIAFAHGSFNIGNTIVLFPFIGTLAWLVTKLVPGVDLNIQYKPRHLDPLLIKQSSSLALEQAKSEIVHMVEYAYQGLEETAKYAMTSDLKHAEIATRIETAINHLDQEVTDYLVAISADSLTTLEREKHGFLLYSVRDVERMGDHFENIIELIEQKISHKINFSEESTEDLHHMFDLTLLTIKQSILALKNSDKEAALNVLRQEDQIDKMEREYRKSHIIRVNDGLCSASAGIIFVDILSNLERIGDHCVNIAEEILGSVK